MVDLSRRLGRSAIVLAAAALLWALLLVTTGGFVVRVGAVSLSSRAPRNALLIALLAVVIAWTVAPTERRSATVGSDVRWLLAAVWTAIHRTWRTWTAWETRLIARAHTGAALGVALVVAAAVVAVGFREGALVAAGSDASGYVSQADLWARGTLRIEQPLMRELAPQIPAEALAPLAFRPSLDGGAIVPVVAPGLPMLMALFQLIGGREAVFYVLPLMAAVAIVGIYRIARHVGGPWSGAAAAILLAASPSFLFQLTSSPMSDIPATAWWALALGLVMFEGGWTALAAGAAAGAAILTRTNLAPLAAIPCALLLVAVWRDRTAMRPRARLAMFACGVTPAFLAVAWLNDHWYGSPWNSGYGSLGEIYNWQHIGPNLDRYPRWLLESQTPLVLTALLAPSLLSRRLEAVMLLVFACGVLASYLPYVPFDVWWYLRFLLPAYPALLALAGAVVVRSSARLPAGTRIAAAAAAIGLTAWHGVAYAAARATFDTDGEWKYAIAGQYISEHLPEHAVLLAEQHSGSARYYSGRTTIRWAWIPPDRLEWMLGEIERLGYESYAVIEDWEEPAIRARFAGRPALAALDRAPLVELPLGHVRLYRVDALTP
jgi:4-amino-4-deoxy-L-arabinose transferase-like glycosyltransferase